MCAKSYGSEFEGITIHRMICDSMRVSPLFSEAYPLLSKNVRFLYRDKKGGISQQNMSENPSKNQCQEKRRRREFLNIIAWLTLILQGNCAEPSVSPISFKIETVTFCWDAPAGPIR